MILEDGRDSLTAGFYFRDVCVRIATHAMMHLVCASVIEKRQVTEGERQALWIISGAIKEIKQMSTGDFYSIKVYGK